MFEDFGEKVKGLRIQHHMTQEDLARKIEVSLSTIGRWERGRAVTPSTKNLIDICLLFGVSINDLAGLAPQNVIAIDMLTQEQQILVNKLVLEFLSETGKQAKPLSGRQSEIIQMLLSEFKR